MSSALPPSRSRVAPVPDDSGGERALARWLEAAEREADAGASGWTSSPAEVALGGLLAAADAALATRIDQARWEVRPEARRALVGLLSRRLTTACAPVLTHERLALDATSGAGTLLDASVHGWRERFETYPVLAWVMTRVLAHWRGHVEELLSRFTADRELLGVALFQGRVPRVLTGVRGDLGDAHAGGRSVAILEFEEGARAVYKPKDLRITGHVQELCAFLNARGLPLPLHVRQVLCREGYAWEEFVPAAPCPDAAGVERFYRRIGMFVRLLQVLEGRDLWLDNLVAAGEHPVFVDLEMVLQPRRRTRAETPAVGRARERLEESVALLGILAAPLPIAPGGPSEELGALTPPRAFLSPLRRNPALAALTGDSRPSREGHVLWTHEAYAPTLNGVPARAAEHFDALLEGYRAMHATLRANAGALLGAGSVLSRMAGVPVRYIHRDTWACYQLTLGGLAPALLTRHEVREAAFEPLLRVARAHPEPEAEETAVQAERDALRQLDVPYFLSHPGSEALFAPNGTVLHPRFFEGHALDRARRRLEELEAFPLARHEDLFRSTFATGRHAPPRVEALEVPEVSEPDWLAEAVAVGDAILAEAVEAEGGLAWLGLTYHPLQDVRKLDVLPPDLLTGSAGIALVLAELHRASGHSRFRTGALGALEATRLEVARGSHREVGALHGLGSQLRVLLRCAEVLEAPELGELARARIASLPGEAWLAQAPLDFVSGLAGLLLVVLTTGERPATEHLMKLLERRLAEGPPRVSPPRLLEGVPTLAEGLELCAIHLERHGGHAPPWRIPVEHPVPRVRPDAPLETLERELTMGSPSYAQHRGARLLATRHLHGRWFPERWEADAQNLSALWGLSAVAYSFLRLRDARLPSLRRVSRCDTG